jgi:DNA-binding response OmpR family regulator
MKLLEIPATPNVAIFNSNEDLMEIVSFTLEKEGFQTVIARVPEIRRGKKDVVAFLKKHNPAVIIYDIPPPYEENWNFFLLLRNLEIAQGRHFILTTTNKAAIERLIGGVRAIEIYGKPFDLKEIIHAVKIAINLGTQSQFIAENPTPTSSLITNLKDKS